MELTDRQIRSHPAYGSSIALHATIVAAIVAAGLAFSQSHPAAPTVFEIVAGAGDNYTATQATALGSEDGIKFNAPAAPTPPAPPAQAEAKPVPLEAAPAPERPVPLQKVSSAKSVKDANAANFAKSLRWSQIKAESRIKMAKLREERKLARERRLAELAAARKSGLTYEQFLKQQAAKGRAGGVIHGTSMEAGAGGHALTSEQQDAMVAWTEMLRERWKDSFVAPPDFTESMVAHVKWFVSADGSISRIRITHSTGNAAFDEAVVDALRQITVPPPPSHRGDDYETDFSLKNED